MKQVNNECVAKRVKENRERKRKREGCGLVDRASYNRR